MTLPRHLLIVDVMVDPSVEDDWNVWYDSQHLPEILNCPGVLSGARYRAQGDDDAARYVTVYELDSPQAMHSDAFKARRGWGRFQPHVRFTTACFQRLDAEADNGR